MSMFRWHSVVDRTSDDHTTDLDERSLLDRPDLRIGNLLDDPGLRRAMGLDAPPVSTVDRPVPRFDRRRLLDRAAA
ncbi:MAG: hypothetical protein ACLGHQ_00490 [Acidimicrobiia bacterium]